MTKRYEITRLKVTFGPGYVLQLDKEQAKLRQYSLEHLKKDHYQVLSPVEFKQGEIIGVVEGDVPKAFWHSLKEADGKPEDKPEAPEPSKTPEKKANDNGASLSLKHRYFGKYDVINANGSALTEKPLPKDEAQAFLNSLLEDESESEDE